MKPIDISGKRFGGLVVSVEISRKNPKLRRWLVTCDCRYMFPVNQISLTQGSRICCKYCSSKARKIANPSGDRSPHFRGVGKLSASRFSEIRKGARHRKIEFSLSIEQAWSQFEAQAGYCALSAERITLPESKAETVEATASLDRIDSSEGYVPGNVQWVHKRVQIMKMDMTDEELIRWSKKIASSHE